MRGSAATEARRLPSLASLSYIFLARLLCRLATRLALPLGCGGTIVDFATDDEALPRIAALVEDDTTLERILAADLERQAVAVIVGVSRADAVTDSRLVEIAAHSNTVRGTAGSSPSKERGSRRRWWSPSTGHRTARTRHCSTSRKPDGDQLRRERRAVVEPRPVQIYVLAACVACGR